MTVMLAKTLMASLASLNAMDTKRVTDFIDKFYVNPAHPSLSLERVTKGKDNNLWSARITQGLRAILYKETDTWALLYAGQHDAAYAWATSRRIEKNDRTGALQIVEFTESVTERLKEKAPSQPGLFDIHTDDYLLSLGLPPLWLPVVRQLTSDDDLLDVLEKLPEEVGENFIRLASGELVIPPSPLPENQPVTASEDTRRRFVVVESSSDIAKLLEAPLATWIGFLHPSQHKLATGSFKGPVKITGSAGTGKTVVALHRARNQARQGKRVLLTTFVTTLCDNLKRNLRLLCDESELALITVGSIASIAGQIIAKTGQRISTVDDEYIQDLMRQHYDIHCPLDIQMLWLEWKFVIQPQAVTSWDEYRAANRTGRGQPLSIKERKLVWQVFEGVLASLRATKKVDWASFYRYARELITSGTVASPFDAVIVDETQDLKPQELMFLAAIAGEGPNRLTVVGDGGQRIYQGKFSLKALGINVQGRSHILKVNYRTTEQIRRFADRLTDPLCDDLDGSKDRRRDTTSILRGPEPILKPFASGNEQAVFIATEIAKLTKQGLPPDEIAVFARTRQLLKSIEEQLATAQIPFTRLDENNGVHEGAVNVGTMHRAKGLEFKVVFAVSISDNTVPLPQSLKAAVDATALAEAIEQEKHLLYVSVTRARDLVYVCWNGQPSRYLEEVLTCPKGNRSGG